MLPQDPELSLPERIQELVERSTTRIEEIHKSIARIPLDVMRESGVFEQTAEDVSDLQERSIGVVYEAVRAVNRSVADLASDLLRPPRTDPEAHAAHSAHSE